ncbi:hypothetical protein ABBQ38_002175 [Trebouxia sp. C0009 RCD-2024]
MQAQEDQPNLGSVLHCALLLLGYKSSSYEVEADATMFDRSNTKGMEALLHFLLSRLRGSLQAKKARSNRNKLTVLQTTSALLEGCTSILQDFKGLWPIKDTRQQRDYRKESLVPLELVQPAMMVAAAQNKQQRARFLRNAAAFCTMQDHWQTAADHLLQQFKQLQQKQQQQRECEEALNAGSTTSPPYQPEQLQQAEQMWHNLQSLVDLRRLVDGVVGSQGHPHCIDGHKLGQAAACSDGEVLAPACGVDIVLLLQGLADAVATYGPGVASLAGGNNPGKVTPLALPTNLGGHQGHIAAALASSKQHLQQQKQLNAALQVDISAIGKRHAHLLPLHILQRICML